MAKTTNKRYAVVDLQKHEAPGLRRPSTSINPRYLVVDTTTSATVDALTTRAAAVAMARYLNTADRGSGEA